MKDFLEYASKLYYEGTPILSDEEFDYLESIVGDRKVGYSTKSKFKHLYQMYSLQKCYDLADAPISDLNSCICTPKLDGAAISILYVNGELKLALTRGDGVEGIDITEKVRNLVPSNCAHPNTLFVTGEVVAPKTIPNARNYVAGALNLKSLEEFKSRDLTFVAYDVQGFEAETWLDKMEALVRLLPLSTILDKGLEEKFPTDGYVYRINDMKTYESLGFTATHPRGAFALKQNKEGVVTKLLDVTWQVGKSGAVSPVAILQPVEIGGAMVSRATLHNMAYINALNLEIGCEVKVIRAGEIIPRIIGRADLVKNGS